MINRMSHRPLQRLAPSFPSRQRGLTMTELIFALVVFGAVISTAVYLFASGTSSNNARTASQQAITLAEKVKGFYRKSGSYNGLSTLVVARANLATEDMILRDNAGVPTGLRDVWGNTPVVGAVNGGAEFQIAYAQVPNSDCAGFISSAETSWRYIQVGQSVVKNLLPGQQQSLDRSALSVSCGSAANVQVVLRDR